MYGNCGSNAAVRQSGYQDGIRKFPEIAQKREPVIPHRFDSTELLGAIKLTIVVNTKNTLKMRMRTKMNVILTRWFSILSLSGIPLIPLQHASAQSDQDLIEVARSVVTADRKAVVVAALELTDSESKDFWPLYHEYRTDMDKIGDERLELVLNYAKLYPTVPEEQAKEMLNTYTSLEQRQVEQRNVYLKKFSKVLPSAKALRLAQVETRLDLLIHLNLAARIPLTPISQAK